MSPRSTFHSWGSSSILVLRRTRPARVMRGSRAPVMAGPCVAASRRMLRTLYMVNDRPYRPARVAPYSTGRPSSRATAAAAHKPTGHSARSPAPQTSTSKPRLAARIRSRGEPCRARSGPYAGTSSHGQAANVRSTLARRARGGAAVRCERLPIDNLQGTADVRRPGNGASADKAGEAVSLSWRSRHDLRPPCKSWCDRHPRQRTPTAVARHDRAHRIDHVGDVAVTHGRIDGQGDDAWIDAHRDREVVGPVTGGAPVK